MLHWLQSGQWHQEFQQSEEEKRTNVKQSHLRIHTDLRRVRNVLIPRSIYTLSLPKALPARWRGTLSSFLVKNPSLSSTDMYTTLRILGKRGQDVSIVLEMVLPRSHVFAQMAVGTWRKNEPQLPSTRQPIVGTALNRWPFQKIQEQIGCQPSWSEFHTRKYSLRRLCLGTWFYKWQSGRHKNAVANSRLLSIRALQRGHFDRGLREHCDAISCASED